LARDTDRKYRHIKFPMIATEPEAFRINPENEPEPKYWFRDVGELLHPERDSQEVIDELRQDMTEYAFQSQLQQSPIARNISVVKENWLHFYNNPNGIRFTRIIMSWDTACKTTEKSAYSSCVTIGVASNGKLYILDCYRGRLELQDLENKVKELHSNAKEKYRQTPEIIIEDASSGIGRVQILASQQLPATGFSVKGDKQSRLESVGMYVSNGSCLFPSSPTNWWEDFKDELLTFPNTIFKDQVDAFSQGIAHAVTTKKSAMTDAHRPTTLTAGNRGYFPVPAYQQVVTPNMGAAELRRRGFLPKY